MKVINISDNHATQFTYLPIQFGINHHLRHISRYQELILHQQFRRKEDIPREFLL